jgi:hypothetical protein
MCPCSLPPGIASPLLPISGTQRAGPVRLRVSLRPRIMLNHSIVLKFGESLEEGGLHNMNSERLHAVTKILNKEMSDRDIISKIQNLIASLQNVISQPQHPSHQQGLADNLKAFHSSLEDSIIDKLSPAWR